MFVLESYGECAVFLPSALCLNSSLHTAGGSCVLSLASLFVSLFFFLLMVGWLVGS